MKHIRMVVEISQRDVAPHGMAEYPQVGVSSGKDVQFHQPMEIEKIVLIGRDESFEPVTQLSLRQPLASPVQASDIKSSVLEIADALHVFFHELGSAPKNYDGAPTCLPPGGPFSITDLKVVVGVHVPKGWLRTDSHSNRIDPVKILL